MTNGTKDSLKRGLLLAAVAGAMAMPLALSACDKTESRTKEKTTTVKETPTETQKTTETTEKKVETTPK